MTAIEERMKELKEMLRSFDASFEEFFILPLPRSSFYFLGRECLRLKESLPAYARRSQILERLRNNKVSILFLRFDSLLGISFVIFSSLLGNLLFSEIFSSHSPSTFRLL